MKRHELDPVSLVAGVLFAVIGATSLLDHADILDIDGHWLWPAVLISLGMMGLLTALRPERSASAPPDDEADTTEADGAASSR